MMAKSISIECYIPDIHLFVQCVLRMYIKEKAERMARLFMCCKLRLVTQFALDASEIFFVA